MLISSVNRFNQARLAPMNLGQVAPRFQGEPVQGTSEEKQTRPSAKEWGVAGAAALVVALSVGGFAHQVLSAKSEPGWKAPASVKEYFQRLFLPPNNGTAQS